jgi:CRP-like cAMP-binding protein
MNDSLSNNILDKSENYSLIKKGQVIFHEGFAASNLIIIINGVVKLSKNAQTEVDSLLDIRHNGDVIGIESFSAAGKYFSTARAVTDCKILVVNRSTLAQLKDSRQEEYMSFIQASLMKNIASLQNRIFLLKESSARTKIAYILLLFSDKKTTPSQEIILSREELAELAEVSRETASREISYFNKNKILKVSGRKIVIVNREKLQSLLSALIQIPSIKIWDDAMKSSFQMFKEYFSLF